MKIKAFHLLKHLAKSNDVTLVAFSFGRKPSPEELKPLTDLGIKVHTLTLNPIYASMMTVLRLPLKYPLEISFYLTREYKNLVDKLCEENNFDLGISFFMRSAEYIKDKNFRKILIAEDCRVLYQSRSFDRSDNILQKLIRFWEVRKLKKYEPELSNMYDIVTLVTKEDISEMQKDNSKGKFRLVTNGVDIEQFQFNPPYKNRPETIIFTGLLSVWANIMMANKIATELFPKIKKEIPGLKFLIVGSNPPNSVKKLASDDIEIHSDVQDITQYYSHSRVFIHPHAGASGIQNKILEAMAAGCAVITTHSGNQGIYAEHGVHAMIAENEQEFVEYTIKLLKDDDFAKKITDNARQLILDTHTWDIVNEQIDNVINELFNE